MESFIAALPVILYAVIGLGLALFLFGIVASLFPWGWGTGAEAAEAAEESVGTRIVKAIVATFKGLLTIFNSASTPRWQRLSTGGLILIILGLVALAVVLIAPHLPGGGGETDPSSVPTTTP